MKEAALLRCAHLCVSFAVLILRYLVNPMLAWTLSHEEFDILSPQVVHDIVQHVLRNPDEGARAPLPIACPLPIDACSSSSFELDDQRVLQAT